MFSMLSMKFGVYLWLVLSMMVCGLIMCIFCVMFVFVRLRLVSMLVGFLLSRMVCCSDYVMLLVVIGLLEWNVRFGCSLNV